MKKITFSLFFVCLFSFASHAQLMVAKLVGKDAAKYGLGYGVFAYYDFPLASGNKSFRIELMDLAVFPSKGENLFTSTADGKAYISIKLGYKYVFSETQAGFYLLPSAGYCRAIFVPGDGEPTYGDGIAGALEGGYTLEVGQNDHPLNFGLKYEYDHGNATHIIQSVGFRVSYGFNMFRKKE
ncbi:MAG: hypothetical protein M3342_08860 [Bacteroidota bacterium]|nr:hypothetical protein [Bacteroidota bacterium]